MNPPDVLQDDIFPLKKSHMFLLQKYIYSGVLLPTTVSEYQKDLYLNDAAVILLRKNIDDILKVYSDIRLHTTVYKDKIHPSTAELATAVAGYARGVPIYYKGLYKAIAKLDEASSLPLSDPVRPVLIKEGTTLMNAIIDTEVKYIDRMVADAAKVVADVTRFSHETDNDRTKLIWERNALDIKRDELDKDGGISLIMAQMIALIVNIKTLEKPYDQALEKAVVPPKWLNVTLLGCISPAVASGALSAQITGFINIYKTSGNIFLQIQQMSDELDKLRDLITPALLTLQLLEGTFGSISHDLNSIRKRVNDDIREAKVIIADIQLEAALEAWEGLLSRAEQYRNIAYVAISDGF